VLGVPVVETSFHAEDAIVRPRTGDAVVETRSAPGEAGAYLPALAAQAGRFTGRRIDLDLKDADIHNVLRLLADVGRVNVITSDNVSGTVTIRMRNVPWDQALEVVLQSKNLGMVRQGNLLRVAPLADLEKEREMAIARRRQELELAPVVTRLVPVSYAQANEVQARAKEMLSPRGSISVDERTNVLILRDVEANLNQIEELVHSLDTQTPQVLVEARIVEATSRYLRDVGIQWGGDASFSPATGNPTGVAFPSAIGLAGGATDSQTPTAGLSPFDRTVANPNFAVNLPAAVGTGSGGAIGLTLGSINNAVNLGVRLSAAESSGMLRIISSPRILTMDNKDARISQGTLIPFAQISAQGVQTTFQEAKLQLLVRPHVTAEGSVAMHVKVNRDEPDFNQTSPRGDPTILKREAETDLLVMDGHTAVIGGIYTRNTGRNLDQVPFFGDIPLLGLLFQRRRASDSRGELVIFLTPRIVNRSEALGH
jgi:type IV pilus assembly protein PilQ